MAINQLKTAVATALPGALTPEAIAVRGALLARGLETPMTANGLSRDERYDVIRASFTQIFRYPWAGPARRQLRADTASHCEDVRG